MSESTKSKKTKEIPLPRMLREELYHIKPPDDPVNEKLEDVFEAFHKAELSALCFSGGGIRSATFGLGIVQSLAKRGLLDNFDYLSTVSGGGYLGAWLSAWIRREQMKRAGEADAVRIEKELAAMQETAEKGSGKSVAELEKEIEELNAEIFDVYQQSSDVGVKAVQDKLKSQTVKPPTEKSPPSPNPEPEQLQHLREYSNYMSPKVGLLSADTWTLIGIYVRNLFLNWTIFIPLICAVLLVPRILLELTRFQAGTFSLTVILMTALFAGTFAVVCTVRKLPSKNLPNEAIELNTDAGVFFTVIAPLIVTALAATTFWAWINQPGQPPLSHFDFLPSYLKSRAVYFVLFSVLIFVAGNALFFIARAVFYGYEKLRFGKRDFSDIAASIFSLKVLLEIVSAAFSAAVSGVLMWLIANNFFGPEWLNASGSLSLYVCFAVPLYLLSFSTGATVFAGIYSKFATDEDREWLARQGAWLLIVCCAWILLNGLVIFGTDALAYFIGQTDDLISKISDGSGAGAIDYIKTSIVPIIVAVSGFISLVGGYSGKSTVKENEPNRSLLAKFLAVAPRIAAVVFLGFIFVGLAYVAETLITETNEFLRRYLIYANRQDITVRLDALPGIGIYFWIFWLAALAVVGVAMACFINVNKFSLHAAYRDRLIRAYLGASRINRKGNAFTGFDDADNFQLHRLKGQKPFHIINATLNLVAGKNLAWQNRKAASFTMSPLHCGSWLLGYRNTNLYCRNKKLAPCKHLRFCNRLGEKCDAADAENCKFPGKALRLGTAMTISGAAANPNMGYYSSSVVTFLMTLFNIRLGWWLGNTGARGDDKDWGGFGENQFYTKASPSIAVLPLINETLGLTNQDKHFLNVTDGGHFENLGLYEMILRRCKLIVLSDAAADENFTFGEISNAIEKCKVDLGVNINFKNGINICSRSKVDAQTLKNRFAVAEIIYPEMAPKIKEGVEEHRKGYLIYIRPTFYGDEATEIKHYADANLSFPHQSTADQLYDEKQFEAYRALGFCIMEKVFQEKSADDLFESLKKRDKKIKPRQNRRGSSKSLSDLLSSEGPDAV